MKINWRRRIARDPTSEPRLIVLDGERFVIAGMKFMGLLVVVVTIGWAVFLWRLLWP